MSQGRPGPMLDQADINAALQEMQNLLGANGALAGGVALQRLGSRRFTANVDFVVSGYPPGLKLGQQLVFGGHSVVTSRGVPVDLILRSDDFRELYVEALKYARRDAAGVRSVSPEYLCAMKMVAGRGKDASDLEWLLTSGAVDIAKARRIIKRVLGAYAAKDFDKRVSLAEWERSRE